MVQGGATLRTSGTSSTNQAYFQISDTPSAGPVAPYFTIAGSGDHDSPNSDHYFSAATQRVFMVSAGTYEFRLESWTSPDNGGSAVSTVVNPYLTATFFPTAYGTVSASAGTPTP
jgi:hypothetical protein